MPPEAPLLSSADEPGAREVEARLRAILDSALDALITIDEGGEVVEFNRAAEEIFGYSRDQAIGREMAEIIVPPSLRAQHRRGMEHFLRTGEGPILGHRIEITGMRADGSEFPVELTVTRVHSPTRTLFTGTLRDISDRRRIEGRRAAQYEVTAMLAASASLEEATPKLLEAIGLGLGWEFGQCWTVDAAARVLRWRSAWSLTGRSTAEFEEVSRGIAFAPGIGLPGRVWEEEVPAWLERVSADPNFPRRQAAVEAGWETGFAFPIRTARRIIGVLEFFTAESRPDDDDVLRFTDAIGRQIGDFVDRIEAEREVRESENRYRRILETTNEGIWWIDADARTVYVNERLAAMLGEPSSAMTGRSLVEYLDEPEKEQLKVLLARRRQGIPEQFDMRFRRSDGSPVWAIVSATPVPGPDGEFSGSLAMITDISDRKRAEDFDRFLVEVARVLGSSLDYEVTLKQLTDLAVPRVADWCQVGILSAAGELKMLEVSHVDPAKAEVARTMNERFPPDPEAALGPARVARTGEPELVSEIPDALLEGATRSPEHLEMVRSLGLRSYVCVPMRSRGRILGTITFVSAESGHRYDAADLVFAEQIAGLAAMAIDNARLYRDAQTAIRLRDDFLSIAGHELRTPLSSLFLDIERLARLADGQGGVAGQATPDRVRRSMQRLSRLIDELLDVARLSAGRLTLEPEEIELASFCREAADRFAEDLARRNCRLEIRSNGPGPIIEFWDPNRLDQVVGNLISNAIKYGEGAPIEIALRAEGPDAVIEVRDHGIGIPSADHERIFLRFERAVSNARYGGIGLGLWIASEIVRASGGTISVDSQPGSGSTFQVRLVRHPPEREPGS